MQEFTEPFANGEAGWLAGRPELLTAVNEDSVLPVDLLGVEIRGVGLCGSGFIEKFVVRPAFVVAFASDDFRVLFGSDAALALAADFRPCGLCQDMPCESAEVCRQVVEPS